MATNFHIGYLGKKNFLAFGDKYTVAPDDITWIVDYRKAPTAEFDGISIYFANGDVLSLDKEDANSFWLAFCKYTGLYSGT